MVASNSISTSLWSLAISTATRIAASGGWTWLVILLKVVARTSTISRVLIAGHDRFPTYYGSEFASKAMDAWSYQYGVHLEFIRPGKPVDNGYMNRLMGAFAMNA
jgi:transposase InsO family protein